MFHVKHRKCHKSHTREFHVEHSYLLQSRRTRSRLPGIRIGDSLRIKPAGLSALATVNSATNPLSASRPAATSIAAAILSTARRVTASNRRLSGIASTRLPQTSLPHSSTRTASRRNDAFLPLRLRQSHRKLRQNKLNRQPWKSSPRTYVQQPGPAAYQSPDVQRGKHTLAKVPSHHLLRLPHRCQVCPSVPAHQQL